MRHLPRAVLLVAFALVLALPTWPRVVALLVAAVAAEAASYIELRREKIHDVDRQNMAALLTRMLEAERKLNLLNAQAVDRRVAARDSF